MSSSVTTPVSSTNELNMTGEFRTSTAGSTSTPASERHSRTNSSVLQDTTQLGAGAAGQDQAAAAATDGAAAPTGADDEVEMSDSQKKQIKKVFALFDSTKKNVVEVKALGTLLRCLGKNPSERELAMLAKEGVDRTDNQEKYKNAPVIKFDVFLSLFRKRWLKSIDSEGDVVKAFKFLDQDNNKYVLSHELKHLLLTAGEKDLSEDDINDFFKDADRDGRIPYYQFVGTMYSNVNVAQDEPKKKKSGKKGK